MPCKEDAINATKSFFFLEYEIPRLLKVKKIWIALLYRFLQALIILGYMFIYALIIAQNIWEYDNLESAVTTDVKGVVFSPDPTDSASGLRTWDAADYVIPPKDNNAFFVLTNVIVTPRQSQGYCGEDPSVKGSRCTNDSHCESMNGTILKRGNGVISGRCVESEISANTTVCQIYGWCPLENRQLNMTTPFLAGTANSTVFIKNYIYFPKFHVGRRNLLHYEDDTYLDNCYYNSKSPTDKLCPIFHLSTIVEEAGANYEKMALEGGVIQIIIDWDCELTRNSIADCEPEYRFRRLDRGDYNLSKGFNFRYATEFVEGDTPYRTLFKAYGIRFLVNVRGQAYKFSFLVFSNNLATAVGYLALASFICDLCVQYHLKGQEIYKTEENPNVQAQTSQI